MSKPLQKASTVDDTYRKLRAVIMAWIAKNSDLSGWNVIQAYQPTQQALRNKLIEIFSIGSRVVGWQGNIDEVRKDEDTGEKYIVHQERFVEERRIQLDILVDRSALPDGSVSSPEMSSRLRAYLQSYDGVHELLKNGLSFKRIASIREYAHMLDNGRYGIQAGFDVVLACDQRVETIVPKMTLNSFRIVEVDEIVTT